MFCNLSKKVKNDIYLSVCFTVLFTAYNTQSHIQKILTVSIQEEDPSYTADGYVSFGIVNSFIAITMWLSPAIIVIVGRKATLIIGAFCYSSFVSFFHFESTFLTYLGSAITGIGGALLWTGQANYVVMNSKVGDVYQSISIFWMFLEASFLFGNAAVYLEFNDPSKRIDRPMRERIVLILLGCVLLAVVMLFGLKTPLRDESTEKQIQNPLREMKKAFSIMTDKIFLISCIIFVLTGFNLTFLSVLGTSMGFSEYLSLNSKEFAPLAGVMQGLGEIAGCCLSLLVLSPRSNPKSKLRPIFIIGCIGCIITYVLALLGLPDGAIYNYTTQLPLVQLLSPISCLLGANVLFGLADACINIEMYQFLASLYPNDSSPAFAVYKFIRYVAASFCFYISSFGLHFQLIILIVIATMGLISYPCILLLNERRSCKLEKIAPIIPQPAAQLSYQGQ